MQTDINNIINNYETYQKCRTVPKLLPSDLQLSTVLSQPNQCIHVILFGPLKTSKGKKFLLVLTDAFTKYVELVAIPNKKRLLQEDPSFIIGYAAMKFQQILLRIK